MSRFLRALQRVEAGQQSQSVPDSGLGGELASEGSSWVQQGVSPEPRGAPVHAAEVHQHLPARSVSEGVGDKGLAGGGGASGLEEPTDLAPVIHRLRQRSLPGRQPGYCQMAAYILEQMPARPNAVFLFMSFVGQPPSTAAVAPLAAVLGEAVPEPILALDARPDSPELAESFGLSCRSHLKDVLQGQVPWYEAVRKSSLGQLFLLAGTPATELDWSVVSEPMWAHMMGQLRKHYRLILIDAGWYPHPAQKLLVNLSDGVYLVVQLGRTPKRLLRTALQELQEAGATVLGCIAAS